MEPCHLTWIQRTDVLKWTPRFLSKNNKAALSASAVKHEIAMPWKRQYRLFDKMCLGFRLSYTWRIMCIYIYIYIYICICMCIYVFFILFTCLFPQNMTLLWCQSLTLVKHNSQWRSNLIHIITILMTITISSLPSDMTSSDVTVSETSVVTQSRSVPHARVFQSFRLAKNVRSSEKIPQ